MLSELLNLLRFLADPETRKLLSKVSGRRRSKFWGKRIRNVKANFRANETYELSAFADYIFAELEKEGILPKKIDEFRHVFTELIKNAFEHGCKQARNCKVSILCTYSRWFIRLQVSDTGKGFSLQEQLRAADSIKDQLHRGLQIVRKLSYSLYTNKKGNSVTALLLSNEKLEVARMVLNYKGHEIMVLNLRTNSDWQYVNANWEPVFQAVETLGSNLILIDGMRLTSLSSGEWRHAAKTFNTLKYEFTASNSRQFCAFVVSEEDVELFSLRSLDSINFSIFTGHRSDWLEHGGALEQAKEWLIESAERETQKSQDKLDKPHPGYSTE